jgi:hypothetical protein
MYVSIDIGGSGAKIALYNSDRTEHSRYKFLSSDYGGDQNDYDLLRLSHYRIEDALIRHISLFGSSIKAISISTAGNIEEDNVILRWDRAYNLIWKLVEGGYIVYACNDGEAHMLYCLYTYNNITYLPALCIALGTGVALTVCDSNGNILKTTGKHFNLNNIILYKSYNVHDILGNNGYVRFGHKRYIRCLSRFILMFASFFNVNTVFLGGSNIYGISALDIPYNCVLLPSNSGLLGALSLIP